MSGLISIIVPAYNAEKTITRCTQSILEQSAGDFELLLIDDGSTDRTGEICDRFAETDCRIKVFHKPNGGVSSARNLGLDNANGEWITFVDSDDWVKKDYLSHMLSLVSGNTDLVIAYSTMVSKEGYRTEKYPELRINNENIDMLFTACDMHWHTAPWGKLYKMEIIRNNRIYFPSGMQIGEDAYFLYTYIMYVNNIYVSSQTDYYYVTDMGNSLTKQIHSVESEIFVHRNIKNLTTNLISTKNITDITALTKIKWIEAYYIRRILNALYYNKTALHKRISILQSLNIETYIRYIGNIDWKEKVYCNLLRLHMLRTYDVVRYCISKIRK